MTTVSADATAVGDNPLPFDLPSVSTMRASSKKVYAHYFPPFPLSLDNVDPASDYYTRNYLNPDGEAGKHAAYGGHIRDRPVGRPVRGTAWRLEDLQNEVRQAINSGIDGFAVDIMVIPPSTNHQVTTTRTLMKAAEAVDPGFKIMLMLDMSGSVPSVSKTSIAAFLAELGASPAALRSGSKLVVSAFAAEFVATSWYTELFNILQSSYGISVDFQPTFLNEAPYRSAFAPLMTASGNWGNRNPAWNDPTTTCVGCPVPRIREVQALNGGTMKWMQPVSIQDMRPNQSIFDEAQNTKNLRDTWQIARNGGANSVQIPTWNDYTEGAQLNPTERSGYTWLDINAYYTTWYKLGVRPTIVRDGVYVTHRIHPVAATPSYPQTQLMRLRGGSPARDTVEALTFLTAAATVNIAVGANTYSCAAPAGEGVCTVPLSPGTVSAKVVRDGSTVASVTSPNTVKATPYVQDFTYVAASSGRQGTSGTTTAVSADTSAPSVPTNVNATVSGSTVALSWTASTDNVGVTQYDIHRSTVAAFSPSSATVVGSSTTPSFTNSSVPAGTWYYRVAARDAAGNWGAPSSEATAVVAEVITTTTDTTAPSVPVGLAAAVSGSSVALSWTASTDNVGVTQYDVHRGTTATFSPTSLTVVAGVGTSTTFTHNSVATGTWYYRVAARDATGNWSALSSAATAVVADITTVTADTTAPSVPAGLGATVSGSSVALAWTSSIDAVGVTQYDVHRGTTATFSPTSSTVVAGVGTNTNFTHTSVLPGTWYYRVAARDAAGNWSALSTAAIAVVGDSIAPATPSAVAASVSGASVALSWAAATDNVGVTSYDVHRSAFAEFSPSPLTLLGNVTGTSFTNNSVTPGTWYYRVTARDAAGNSSLASSAASAVVADTTAPTTPTGINVTVSGLSATLSWQPSSDDVGVIGYDIYRSGVLGLLPGAETLIGSVTGTTFTYNEFLAGTSYYRIVAKDAAGNRSGASADATVTVSLPTVEDTTAPSAPAVTALLSGSTVSLSWAPSSDNVGVTGYDIHRASTAEFTPTASTLIANVTGTNYTNAGVPAGTWHYRVVAKDAAGNSGVSAAVNATIADTVAPTTPTGLAVSSAGRKWSVSVSWTAAADNVGVTGYDIYRSSTSGFTPSAETLVGTVTTTSFAEYSLPRGTWYYRVVAKDRAGNRSAASAQTAATLGTNGRV